jgi:hypothetical protein
MSNTTSSGGVGMGFILFIVFLILKLTGTIDWSWWWVTAPLWIPILFVAAVFGIILLFMGVVALLDR